MDHPQQRLRDGHQVSPGAAATAMRADRPGRLRRRRPVCGSTEITAPTVGDDDVLIGVRAAGVHIGDWHVMTGQPYLMRIMGFGFRAPKARVRGMDVAGTVEAVGANVTRFRPATRCSGSATGPSPSTPPPGSTTLAAKPASLTFEQAAAVPTSAVPRCRRCATPARSRRGSGS